jgi:hypothetical protein
LASLAAAGVCVWEFAGGEQHLEIWRLAAAAADFFCKPSIFTCAGPLPVSLSLKETTTKNSKKNHHKIKLEREVHAMKAVLGLLLYCALKIDRPYKKLGDTPRVAARII